MVTLTLERIAYLDRCTLGRMTAPELTAGPIYTIERPWIPNAAGPGGLPRQSCIPDGRYAVAPHDTKSFPGTYYLENAELGVHYQQRPAGQKWGRTAILIHKGNTVSNVIGCLAVGMNYAIVGGELAVLRSSEALEMLQEILGRVHTHLLVIRPTAGTV